MTPELSETEGDESLDLQSQIYDGDPETDTESKTVVIASERHDIIEITNVVTRYEPEEVIPSEFSVVRREQRYYGPELLLYSEIEGTDQNFLLTAPGPTEQLRLWAAQKTDADQRSGWVVVADVQVALSAEQAPYESCEQCGEKIRTIEHERMSALGRCQR